MINVQTKIKITPITIIYYTWSEISLCNFDIEPLYIDTKSSNKRVTITTVNSMKEIIGKIHNLKINDKWQLETIMILKMKLNLKPVDPPEVWSDLNGSWTNQQTYDELA